MIKRVGRPPVRGKAHILRHGVYAILPLDNALLLTFQDRPFHEFQLPGGGIDPGESPLQALHREVFEETGWRIGRARRLGAFRRFTFMPDYDIWAEKLCQIYVARPVRRHGPPREAGHEPVWASPQSAVKMLANPGDREFVARYVIGP